MKALTLHQPWASLIALGHKKIETRSWRTNYRGPLAIHASSAFPLYARDFASGQRCRNIYYDAQRDGRLRPHDTALEGFSCLPLGCIVAVCRLVRCVEVLPTPIEYRAEKKDTHERLPALNFRLPPDEPERSFGDYTPGRFAWFLEDILPFDAPLRARGAQGLWNCDLPELHAYELAERKQTNGRSAPDTAP